MFIRPCYRGKNGKRLKEIVTTMEKGDHVLAHILVCFLAYVLWKSLYEMAKAAGLGDEPRRIFEELGKISLVDVVLPTRSGVEIRRRCTTRPTEYQAILLEYLGLSLPTQIRHWTKCSEDF